MKFIYKYGLDLKPTVNIELPFGAEILSVHHQKDKIFIWALVDTKEKLMINTFYIVGTGQMFPFDEIDTKFIGTVHTNNGDFVWHIFKELN